MSGAIFREQLTAIKDRLAAHDRGDIEAVINANAATEAVPLAAAIPCDDTGAATEARVALALFRWYRFWALPSRQNCTDLRAVAGVHHGSE